MNDDLKKQINKIKKSLQEIWNYMNINNNIVHCDLIIGCGCANLDIPVRCAELLKMGYANKILFAGGKGKITQEKYLKSEAEIFADIAIKNGVSKDQIILETKSTNTGDNFKFAKEIIDKENIKCSKILIVHNCMNERRTLAAAKVVFKDKELFITSPKITFAEYFDKLFKKNDCEIRKEISVIVGDIQRLILYPYFGWQVKSDVPKNIIEDYYFLKNIGFDMYIITKSQIMELIKKYNLQNYDDGIYFN